MLMNSTSLYLITVLIWGSTWFAIKFQLGVVAAEISLIYRFALASLLLLIYCLWSKKNLRFTRAQHGYIALQGLFLFSSNYLVFYWATGLLTSGIVALLFSTVIVMNIVNGAIFRGQRVNTRVAVGALFGVSGIAGVFWSELISVENNTDSWTGLWMCLVATCFASFGNIISARNQAWKLPVLQTNAWGMGYGALIMLAYAMMHGVSFDYDPTPAYSLSLVYLSVFGSIFAFGSYLTLIGRIGADKAAYTAVWFPVIALGISTLFESYQWTLEAIVGFGLILIGNCIVLTRKSARPDQRHSIEKA